jgi:serine/threonine protein kinase
MSQKTLNNKYYIYKKIGEGSFGKVFLGKDIKTGIPVAIKTETVIIPINKKYKSPLIRELTIYKKLSKENEGTIGTVGTGFMKKKKNYLCSSHINVPKVLDFYKGAVTIIRKSDRTYQKYYQYMVMELLGVDLEKLFNKSNKKFKLINIYSMAHQMINLIESIHNIGWLHRDIKPENFLTGIGTSGCKKVYLIDFGLSRKWEELIDKYDSLFIEGQSSSSIVGTYRYMSINTHKGKSYSWRDDLESLGYVLIYFLRGELPWQGLKEQNEKKRMNKILAIKLQNKKSLCDGLPEVFSKYMNYCWNLKIDDQPEYNYLKNLFIKQFKEQLKISQSNKNNKVI